MQTDEGENDKICKDKEKVEMNGVENVKVEIKDLKNQVSGDMSKLVKVLEKIEVLLKKTPDQDTHPSYAVIWLLTLYLLTMLYVLYTYIE